MRTEVLRRLLKSYKICTEVFKRNIGPDIRPEKADIRPEKAGHWDRYRYVRKNRDMFISWTLNRPKALISGHM